MNQPAANLRSRPRRSHCHQNQQYLGYALVRCLSGRWSRWMMSSQVPLPTQPCARLRLPADLRTGGRPLAGPIASWDRLRLNQRIGDEVAVANANEPVRAAKPNSFFTNSRAVRFRREGEDGSAAFLDRPEDVRIVWVSHVTRDHRIEVVDSSLSHILGVVLLD